MCKAGNILLPGSNPAKLVEATLYKMTLKIKQLMEVPILMIQTSFLAAYKAEVVTGSSYMLRNNQSSLIFVEMNFDRGYRVGPGNISGSTREFGQHKMLIISTANSATLASVSVSNSVNC